MALIRIETSSGPGVGLGIDAKANGPPCFTSWYCLLVAAAIVMREALANKPDGWSCYPQKKYNVDRLLFNECFSQNDIFDASFLYLLDNFFWAAPMTFQSPTELHETSRAIRVSESLIIKGFGI